VILIIFITRFIEGITNETFFILFYSDINHIYHTIY